MPRKRPAAPVPPAVVGDDRLARAEALLVRLVRVKHAHELSALKEDVLVFLERFVEEG